MPCRMWVSASGFSNSPPSTWLCVSMKPGATISPVASITRSSLRGLNLPIPAIRSPTMRTSALRPGLPVPSTTVPPVISSRLDAGSTAQLSAESPNTPPAATTRKNSPRDKLICCFLPLLPRTPAVQAAKELYGSIAKCLSTPLWFVCRYTLQEWPRLPKFRRWAEPLRCMACGPVSFGHNFVDRESLSEGQSAERHQAKGSVHRLNLKGIKNHRKFSFTFGYYLFSAIRVASVCV